MKAILTPQFGRGAIFSYRAEGDVLHVSSGLLSDTFDFTNMPDGVANSIETTLPVNPIVHAERINGELNVTLIHWYGADATDDEKQIREVTI